MKSGAQSPKKDTIRRLGTRPNIRLGDDRTNDNNEKVEIIFKSQTLKCVSRYGIGCATRMAQSVPPA